MPSSSCSSPPARSPCPAAGGRGGAGGDRAAADRAAGSLHWVALAAVPSGLMLSTTTHLTTDIVAMPLLWVLPLGLYLLSFVIAFAAPPRPGQFHHHARAARHPDRRRPRVQRRHPQPVLLGDARPAAAVRDRGRAPCRDVPAAARRSAISPASTSPCRSAACSAACSARSSRRLLFDWAYEHPLLILAAALLVPQFALVPWPKPLATMLALRPAAARLRSFPTPARRGLFGTHRACARWPAASSSRCSLWPASAGAGRSPPASPP